MELAALDLVDSDGPDTQMVAVLFEPGRIGMARARIPEPGPGQLRIKVCWVGICGSDVETFLGRRAPEFVSTPARLGHEVAGVVDAVGPGVSYVHVGDHVATRYVWGALAQYLVCRPFNVVVLPKEFPLIEGSLIEIMPGVLHAADLAAVNSTRSVLVMGQGVSGLVMTQVLRLRKPAALVVTDLFESKLKLAARFGATATYRMPRTDVATMSVVGSDFPNGFDVVIPCHLDGSGVADAVEAAAQNGRIVIYGCLGKGREPLDFFRIHRKRLDLFSTEPKTDAEMRRYFIEGAKLVTGGVVNTGDLITHKLPLSQIDKAFDLKRDPSGEVIHVMVDCQR
jgi:L-iditol 2-dehydrogenase